MVITHLLLNIGDVSCDFTHTPGDKDVTLGTGCSTTDTTVTITTGQTVVLSIQDNSQTIDTSVRLILKIQQ